MPPFFRNDFVSSGGAVALVGRSLFGDEWDNCPAFKEALALDLDMKKFGMERTISRQRELWPTLYENNQVMRRRANQMRSLGFDEDRIVERLVHLGDADRKLVADEIEEHFAERLARNRRCRQARDRLVELLCSSQVVAEILDSDGNRHEVPCEFWASKQALRAVESGRASFRPRVYGRRSSSEVQGQVLILKAQLKTALDAAHDGRTAQEPSSNSDSLEPHRPGRKDYGIWADRATKLHDNGESWIDACAIIAQDEGVSPSYVEREVRRVRNEREPGKKRDA